MADPEVHVDAQLLAAAAALADSRGEDLEALVVQFLRDYLAAESSS